MFDPQAYRNHVKSIFQRKGDPERALNQMRYMRNKFEYYGLKSGEWIAFSKEIMRENGIPEGDDLKNLARLCFDDEYREVNYFALELVQKAHKQQPEDFILFIEELITTKSWWDTVDWIVKFVAFHFKKYPHLVLPVTERWMASGNIWLQRVCLLFQLGDKGNTDFDLMKKYILQIVGTKEFFLQKGAGWALRQYSKTNPAGVVEFIKNNPQLPALTKREGLKWLKNQGKI